MIFKKIIPAFFFLSVLFAGKAEAQNSRQVSNQWHGWYMYFGTHKLSKKFNLLTEYQWRRADVITTWQQSLARVALEYKVADNVATAAGYGFIITYPYGDQPVAFAFNEHRAFEQLVLTHKSTSGRFNYSHRYRLEQRWMESVVANTDGSPRHDSWIYRNRVRYMFRVNIPLNKAAMEKGAIFLSLYDEVFVNFGKNVNYNIFDQNRFYTALGYQFLKNANIQLGYMNQTIQKSDGKRLENNNTLQVALTYNLDFTKKEKE